MEKIKPIKIRFGKTKKISGTPEKVIENISGAVTKAAKGKEITAYVTIAIVS